MTDYSDLPTYEKKALLRSSADAGVYRKNMIIFGCFLLVIALILTVALIAQKAEYRERMVEYERWYAGLDDAARQRYESFPAMLDLYRPEPLDPTPFSALIPVLLLWLGVGAFYAWKYYSVTHDPDNFEFSVIRFGHATRGLGRGTSFFFTVTLRTSDGETKTLDTNKVFSHSLFEMDNDVTRYENRDVLVAYNPVTDTLAVIRPN